jgi:hypothetical protein
MYTENYSNSKLTSKNKDLMATIEKREANRHKCKATIKWSYLGQSLHYDGNILNFSNIGIYIESKVAPRPGKTIWFRIEQRCFGCSIPELTDFLPTISVVDTKWMKLISDDSGDYYAFGLKYQQPGL